MKKIFSLVLALALIILSFPMGVFDVVSKAATDSIIIWDGLSRAQGEGFFVKGDGTAENPYIIENGDQLYKMVYDMGKTNGDVSHYKLACDIYLNDISNYDSWGKSGFDMSSLNNWGEYQDTFCHRTFSGNFNGDGHTIYGLYVYGYRTAAFLPNLALGAVVRNINFRYSYAVNTSNVNANDQEDSGANLGEQVWYAGVYGSAGVILGRCDGGDGDLNTIDSTITNCSVQDAYVEAAYFTSAIAAAVNSCQPYFANCMVANVTLNSTDTKKGAEGGVLNLPYGPTNPAIVMENILSVGLPIYGAEAEYLWSGKKAPTASHTYTCKNVYTTASNKYSISHSSYGNLSFTDSEINVVDESKLIGAEAEKTLSFDWAYTWRAVDGGYPVPLREYVVPTGDDYYQNGGPKYTTDMWDGTAASHFAAGDGSIEDPYLIANCEEFYRMVTMPEADKYYKIANGVTDLYFNDIEGKSYSSIMSSFSSSWFFSGKSYNYDEDVCFSGNFDGNGVTIYGVRSSATTQSALFTQLGNATLKNFTVKYSYFKTSSSSATGAAVIASEIKENSVVQIKNIAVIDSNVDGKTTASGFVGNVKSNAKVYIENCIVSAGKIASKGQPAYQAAFVADGQSSLLSVKNSISLGIYPASTSAFSCGGTYTNVYTDTAPSTAVTGIKQVENSALQGETAKTTCSEFNWNYSWSVTDTIPMPRNQQNENGVVGAPWSGEIAMSFASGDGTKYNPYLINTAEMLARMLVHGNSGEYYKLSANIYINDITNENWENGALDWFTSNDVAAFEGNFDGNGYIVYGLYGNANAQDEYAALIPVLGTEAQIRKVKLYNSYLTGIEGAYLGGIAGVLEDNAAVASIMDACIVGDDVTFVGKANVGGIIANVGFSRVIIENCLFRGNITSTGNAYGICESIIGKLDIYESISLNTVPFEASEKITARNIYTDQSTEINGVVVLTTDKMIGIGARNYMTALDFTSQWKLSTNNTPEPIGNTKAYNGVKGQVWSGKVASAFEKGGGTETNPYIIETGEQLALLITKANSYSGKYFKLGCDIYLNDVTGELWQSKSGALNWINSHEAGYFSGYLDGDGYVVYGMHYNFKITPSSSYMGLIPRLSGSAEIKNIGVSHAYIKASTNDSSVYAGGIFGMGSAFYDFYGNKIGISATEGDVFLIPGQTIPTKLPSITNCFVDHTCYIEATAVGGIGCPGGAAVVARDCYVTATLKGSDETREGSILGSNWANCSRVYNCIAFTQSDNKAVSGTQQWIDTVSSNCMHLENLYYYGTKHIFGTTRIKRPQWRVGEDAMTVMQELDWANTWRVEEDGTPVLRVFDKEGRSAEQFSDKYFMVPDVKITFDTNAQDVVVEDMIGKPYADLTLPTPERDGYKFVAWHSFEDLTCEYEYDYFLPRDITLYAEWREVSITQDFEAYPFTEWDCDSSLWRYNTPDNAVEYDATNVYAGAKSMQLMATKTSVSSVLINYRQTLTAGQTYTLTIWVAEQDDLQLNMSLAHKLLPDYRSSDKLVEAITDKTTVDGEWTQYSYTFTAQTPWIAIKFLSSDSFYIDNVVIKLNSDLLDETTITGNVAEGEYYQNTYKQINIANGAQSIGDFGFAYSDFVTDVFISDTVTQIGDYAFYECGKLTDVWYAGSSIDFENLALGQYNNPLRHAAWHFDSCGIGKQHEYDNACDSICNNCEYERTVAEHTYDDDADIDCNICGNVRNTSVVGDVNGDNQINNKDLALLMQYLNEWDVQVDDIAADTNGDGEINNKDYALLMQYVNEWDVELKKQ